MGTKVHLYITNMFSVFPSHKPDSITTIYIFLGIINKLREFKVYLKIIVWYIPIRFHFLKEPKHIQPFLPVHPKPVPHKYHGVLYSQHCWWLLEDAFRASFPGVLYLCCLTGNTARITMITSKSHQMIPFFCKSEMLESSKLKDI